jgi:hypothetical protein
MPHFHSCPDAQEHQQDGNVWLSGKSTFMMGLQPYRCLKLLEGMTYSKIQDGPKDSRLKISAIQFWGRHTESSSDPPIIVLEIAKIWLLRFYHLAFKRSNMEKREMFYTSDWT